MAIGKVIQGVAGFMGMAGRGVAANEAGGLAAGLLGGAHRAAGYAGNSAVKNLFPSIDQLLRLYHQDILREDGLRYFAGLYGADLSWDVRQTWGQDIWRLMVQGAEPEFSTEEALHLFRTGVIDRQRFIKALTRNGFHNAGKQFAIEHSTNLMSPEQAIALYNQGDMPWTEVEKRFLANGIIRPSEMELIYKISNYTPPVESVRQYLKGNFTRQDMRDGFVRNGIVRSGDQEAHEIAAQSDPSPTDLVRFALREVWDRNVVARFGYDEEFDSIPEFKWWMKVGGYGDSPQPVNSNQNPYTAPILAEQRDADGNLIQPAIQLDSWARAYWRAHWDLPSPTQGYQFLHRLRPNRMARYRELIPGVQSFDISDLRLLLKTADYPKPFRDRLAAISYHTITRVDLRRLYDQGIINEDEVYEQNLDAGYNPTDARYLTNWIIRDKRNRKLKKQREREGNRTKRLFKMGVISEHTAIERLALLGMTGNEAAAEIESIKVDTEEEGINAALKALHRQFLRWDIDREEADYRLRRIGILDSARIPMLDRWEQERESTGRRATAAQIARWVVRGLMPMQVAYKRLVAMGYERGDAARIARQAGLDEEIQVARANKAIAQTEKEQIRAAEQEIAAMMKIVKKLQKSIVAGATPGRIKRWLKAGLINISEAKFRLGQLEWSEATIANFLQDEAGLTPQQIAEPDSPLSQVNIP